MAHPYQGLRQSKVEHSRVGKITSAYADGGAVEDPGTAKRYVARSKLRDEMGGKPPPMGFDFTRTKEQSADTMRGQMERAKDISDAVPRGRARGGRAPKGNNVNVIISPSAPPPPNAGMAPSMAGPPPMPPRPPMAPPGAGMVPAGGPPGMPPGPRSMGGRTYATGGAVPGPAWKEGRKAGTQVQHAPGKNDLRDMNRPPVITKATGGAVEHPMKGGKAPHLPGGAGGGLARIAKAHKVKRGGMAP